VYKLKIHFYNIKLKSNIKSISHQSAQKRLNILSIIFAINTLAFSIAYPFLPIYLHTIRKIPMSQVGLIFPAMGLAIIIGSPFSGYLTDKFGRRILMLIGPFFRSLAFFGLALMAAFNAPFIAIALGLFCSSFLGIFFQNSANAYVTDLIHENDRIVAFSKIRVGLNIGWMIGPALGAFLARTPFSFLFLLTGILCLVTTFSVFKFCPELPAGEIEEDKTIKSKTSFLEIFRQDRFFLQFLLLCFLLSLSISQFISTLSIYSTKIVGITKTQLGLLYTINGAIVIVFLIYLNKKLQNKNIFLRIGCGSIVYIFSFIGFGLSLTWAHLIMCIIIMTFAEMISVPATTAAAGSLASPNMVGRYIGLFGLVQGVGWSIGPYFGALLFESYADQPVFLWGILSSTALIAGIGFLCVGFTDTSNRIVNKS
jgi:MFS family permease